MYYIDAVVQISKSFTESVSCGFHVVSRITIDYINKETVVELASWETEESFKSRGASLVTFLTLNDCPRFSVDPSLFALRGLTAVEGSPFYRAEVKCQYDVDHINQVWQE